MNKFALGCGVLIAILLFVVVVAAIAIGGSYNRLVRLQQAVDQSWAQVQNVYQRRADLIPNLVNTVSGAANFEKSTLVEVTNARASVGRVQMQLDPNKAPADAAQLEQFQAAQGQLSNALSRLLLVVERYPELKANQNFLSLEARARSLGASGVADQATPRIRSPRVCDSCSRSWRTIRISKRTRTSSVYRRNWKEPRTEFPSSAATSTRRCRTTMSPCAVSRRI